MIAVELRKKNCSVSKPISRNGKDKQRVKEIEAKINKAQGE